MRKYRTRPMAAEITARGVKNRPPHPFPLALLSAYAALDVPAGGAGRKDSNRTELAEPAAPHQRRMPPKSKKPSESGAAAKKPAGKQAAASNASSRKTPEGGGEGTSDDLAGGSNNSLSGSDVGLTVRIEVNLPLGGDAKTYDAIFASIRKHLMS